MRKGYIETAMSNAKKLKVDKIMRATHRLIIDMNYNGLTYKIWNGYRKKLRRIQ